MVQTNFCNGNKEEVKVFDQKFVLCYERDSDYIFKQHGHQCICEDRYQNRSDIGKLKCVVCRT